MSKRTIRLIRAGFLLAVAAALLPAAAFAGGPIRDGTGTPGHGEPDNDTETVVLTPAQATFMQQKQRLADAIAAGGGSSAPMVPLILLPPCDPDPCPSPAPTPRPSPTATPAPFPPESKTLDTRARQQINGYFCGPASGQVVINWSRRIVISTVTAAGAEDATKNWRKQSVIAGWMGTTTSGTSGAALATGLNRTDAVLRPSGAWAYDYVSTGTKQNFHSMVVADVASFGMPLVLATAPHEADAGGSFLASWPKVHDGAHHWITIRGYDGLPGSAGPRLAYNDSSAGYGGGTGAYWDLVSVLWQVNDWNQGGHIIW